MTLSQEASVDSRNSAEVQVKVTGLSLVVLRCRNLPASKAFYEALGLTFQPERHGVGPAHWSCVIGGLVLELYPSGRHDTAIDRLGFQVSDVDAAVRAIQQLGGTVDKHTSERALVVDPNGVKVELRA